MEMDNLPKRAALFALIDGAAHPALIHPLLQETGVDFVNVYQGLPEEDLGDASLFLARIDDPDAAWVAELDQLDRHLPCLSLVWGRVGSDDLAAHLRAFLFADIGDGMTALVRFFDPRNTGAVFKVWGEQILNIFMSPIERWMYRGRHRDWQRVENDTLTGSRIYTSITIKLDQEDIDVLTDHTEPDELLALVTQLGLINQDLPYLERFADFMPRYECALRWGLTETRDRLIFCHYTYEHGSDFDRHPLIAEALEARRRSGDPFRSVMDDVPRHAWHELARMRGPKTHSLAHPNT